jgi:hypothetical protein
MRLSFRLIRRRTSNSLSLRPPISTILHSSPRPCNPVDHQNKFRRCICEEEVSSSCPHCCSRHCCWEHSRLLPIRGDVSLQVLAPQSRAGGSSPRRLYITGSAAAGAQWYRNTEFENVVPVTERTEYAAVIEAEQSIKLVILPSVASGDASGLASALARSIPAASCRSSRRAVLRSARFTNASRFRATGSVGAGAGRSESGIGTDWSSPMAPQFKFC